MTSGRLPVVFPCLLTLSLAGALTGCASTGATPRPFPRPGAPPETPAEPRPGPPEASGTRPVPDGYAIAGTALAFRGVPYRNGGGTPSGFDCSGLVWYVFAEHGLKVPRTVAEQFRTGREVDERNLKPGDLVFFSTVSPGASHVGIAIGGDEFVHAPSERGDVRVDRLSAPYWSDRFLGARRVTPTPPGAAPSS